MKKGIEIYSIIYIASLILLMLAVLLCGILHVSGAIYLVIAFIAVLVIGYIVGAILRSSYLRYECPECHEVNKINFFQYVFGKRMPGARKLTCKKCHKKNYMEEIDG